MGKQHKLKRIIEDILNLYKELTKQQQCDKILDTNQ